MLLVRPYFWLTCGLLLAISAAAAETDKLQQAIDDLGSDAFLVRERASDRLLAAGAAAVPVLETAAAGRELEAATRSLDVLESLAVDPKNAKASDAASAAVARLAAKEV